MAAAISLMRIGQPSLPFLLPLAKRYEGPTCFGHHGVFLGLIHQKSKKHV